MTIDNESIQSGSWAPVSPAVGISTTYEFTGPRAQLFKDAMRDYPHARRDDFDLMRKHLDPQAGDFVLGFGEGSGYFCRTIADAVGSSGRYVITEPSPEMFHNVPQSVLDLPHVFTKISPIEELDMPAGSFDKAWACGAFHHCPHQTQAIARIHHALKPGGRMVIFDIFQGTPLARHFDTCVARYCVTGHEVKMMSEEFARSLCFLAGFDDAKVRIVDVPHRLVFANEWEMGDFCYKMHALTRMKGSRDECIERTVLGLKEHLTVDHVGGKVILHFDQKGIVAVK
jgi:arsenite methyltransferase